MEIKLASSVIFVKDIQASRRFYEELLDQKVEMDFGPNVGFVGGFALWQRDHASQIIHGRPAAENNPAAEPNFELYFETAQLDEGCKRLEAAGVRTVHALIEQPWGQRVIRFFDPDGHIVELGEPMPAVVLRFLAQGLSPEAVAQRTSMPLEIVKQIGGA